LRIEPVARSGSPEITGRLEGPGWSVDARSPQIEPEAGFTSFASFRADDGERFPAVQWRPGSIHVASGKISAEQADSAVFSVSWAQLFDRARLPDPDVIALSERASAGPPAVQPPSRAEEDASAASGSARPWLALLAAVFTAAALVAAKKMRGKSARIIANESVRSPARAGSR
ncbi:MAG TPA: hypothetical protein VM509_03680, partial [Planctomycetota bacterium]|nr:hypothetical protein [Planctomycetota bacterium]